MSAPRVTSIDATVEFDDGTTCQMSVDVTNGGSSWGHDTAHLAATVDVRDALAQAIGAEW